MLTRRAFLGTVSALAMGARVAPAIELPPVVSRPAPTLPAWSMYGGSAGAGKSLSFDELRVAMWDIYNRCRRDDGDTILELR